MSKVIAFPLTVEARFRGRLSRCTTLRMLDRWAADLKKERAACRLTHEEFLALVARSTVINFQIRMQEVAHG